MTDRGRRAAARRKGAGAALVAIVAAAEYALTLAPGLTWAHDGADGGDLAAAVAALGVPHPPGYPTYVLLGKLFALLPLRDIAFRLNIMSAVCAVVTAVIVYLIALHLLDGDGGDWLPVGTAAAASLFFAFSAVFWSQAVIAEVYALNALFVALLLWLVMVRRARPWLIGLAAGAGLGNHITLVLLAPSLALLWNSGAGAEGTPLGARRLRSPGRTAGEFLLGVLLGLTVYLLLPLASAAQPPVQWGEARTFDGFLWIISGGPYRSYLLGLPLAELPQRLAAWASLLVQQFGWLGILLALLGLWRLLSSQRDGDRRAGVALLVTFVLYSVYAIGYRTADSYLHMIPAYMTAAVWLAVGLHGALAAAMAWANTPQRSMEISAAAPVLCAAMLALLPLWQCGFGREAADASRDVRAMRYVEQAMGDLPPQALVITGSDDHTFALWYGVTTLRPDVVVVDRDLTQFDWYRRQVAKTIGEPGARLSMLDMEVFVPALVEAIAAERPVFLADADKTLQQKYTWTPSGPFLRLTSSAP